MANFDSLSKGGKYTFAKDFLIRARAVQNLKPNFTDEEVIRAVAHKYYSSDISSLVKCVGFVKEECGDCSSLKELVEAPLDAKAKAYVASLESETKDKEKGKDAKLSARNAKEKDFYKAAAVRNGAETLLIKEQEKQRNKNILKLVALGVGVLVGLSLLMSVGGVVGAINGIIGFATNLTFTQTFSLVFTIFAGNHIYEKFFKGKGKDKKKAKDEKKKAHMTKLKEDADKAKEAVENIQKEYANLTSEAKQAIIDFSDAQGKEMSEKAHLANYRATTDMGRQIDTTVNEIKVGYAAAKDTLIRNNAPDSDKKDLEDWYTHYVGSIYSGASKGTISSAQILAGIKQEAELRFQQIIDPLNVVNTNYTEANVHSGTNAATNQTLDEMYAAL